MKEKIRKKTVRIYTFIFPCPFSLSSNIKVRRHGMTDNETTVHLRPKNKDVNNFRSLYDLKQRTNPIVNLYAMKREDNEKQ